MRKILLTLTSFVLVFMAFTPNVLSQNKGTECKVLMESISGNYDGKCKKGLAHGNGIAKGIDTYEGKFKNGLPNGHGVYTWLNGDVYDGNWKDGKRDGKGKMCYNSIKKDSVLNAYWSEDKFVEEIVPDPYEITFKSSNVSRISVTKEKSDRNDIEFVILRNGMVMRNFNYLDFVGNTGSTKRTATYFGFEYVSFPFEGQIRFKASNQLNTAVFDYIVKLKINEKGSWKISIYI